MDILSILLKIYFSVNTTLFLAFKSFFHYQAQQIGRFLYPNVKAREDEYNRGEKENWKGNLKFMSLDTSSIFIDLYLQSQTISTKFSLKVYPIFIFLFFNSHLIKMYSKIEHFTDYVSKINEKNCSILSD